LGLFGKFPRNSEWALEQIDAEIIEVLDQQVSCSGGNQSCAQLITVHHVLSPETIEL
jgi:hypothetical protein